MRRRRVQAPKYPLCKDPFQPLRLHLSRSINSAERRRILSAIHGLPALTGSPICVSVLPQLTAHRGKLLSANSGRGTPVHAASFIRRREIVLETELLRKRMLPSIAVHEVFHFVWARLSNAARASFGELLERELRGKARGELGESAAVKKVAASGVLTKDYVCESFCDTAAWLYAPGQRRLDATLAEHWRARRGAWFRKTFSEARGC